MSRRQRAAAEQQAAQQQVSAVPIDEGASAGSPETQRLQQLAELHAHGVLTDAEFAAAKARVLGI